MKKIRGLILFILAVGFVLIACFSVLKAIYPLKYEYYIEKYSQEFDIDPYLVTGMIKAESNFKSDAVSSKNATGLMQITKSTANWIAKELDVDDFDYETDMTQPELNIKMGCFYISYLLEMYSGREDCATAAYNAGFNNVDRWLSDEKYSGGDTLDNIPFSETERYVSKVLNNKKLYRLLYKNAFEHTDD